MHLHFYLFYRKGYSMVTVDRKEVCDFLNEKADTITLFVQKHGFENISNVCFMAQGTKAYCTLKWNGTSAGLRILQFRELRDIFRKLGVELNDDDTSQDGDLRMYEVLFFEARSVTVWRSYTVTKAEAALRCIDDLGEVTDDKYDIVLRMRCIADEEHQLDQEHGCEYDHMLDEQIVEF